MITKSHIGKILSIHFFDHSIGMKDLIECEVVGKVVEVTSRKVLLEHWSVLHEDKDICRDNSEQMAIAQSTIISFIEYAPKRAKRNY